tara:strand:+ start:313 stop:597 length:285 start_codon:yes stop_codon:yes gene_type:complete
MRANCFEACNVLEKSAFKPYRGFCNQLTGNGPVDSKMVAGELRAQTEDSHDKLAEHWEHKFEKKEDDIARLEKKNDDLKNEMKENNMKIKELRD